MTTIYNDGDFNKIRTQKQRAFQVFLGVTAAYLAFCIGWLIYYVSLPYADPMQTLPKVCVYVASALYVIFVFPFMGIKYHRIRRYYKMIYYLSEGLKNAEENYFVGFERKELQKDYVDVISCVFKTWNRKKSEWMKREAYLDSEKPLPDFRKGDLVKYIVQSNFIVQYEIVERGALQEDESAEEDGGEAAEEPSGKGASETVGAENSADGGGTASESEGTKNER